MFKWLKKLAASKISINITIIEPVNNGVISTTKPRESVDRSAISVTRLKKSNFRFSSDEKTDIYGKVQLFHYTEEYVSGRWVYMSNSGSGDKEEAMKLHLIAIEKGSLSPDVKKTIHWEGLDNNEAKMWVSVQTKQSD